MLALQGEGTWRVESAIVETELIDERQLLSEIAVLPDDDGVLDDAENEAQHDGPPRITPYEINSYGADYDVAGLVRRLDSGDIFIPPFQRNFVWSQPDASRFIESLLLGFPVPAIFLSKESTNRFLVVDGQQRLKSLQQYYRGTFADKKFRLVGIDSRFIDKDYGELQPEDKRTLDNALIHTIIVQQVSPCEPGEDIHSSIYLLFERLNSWGRPLFPQEIRACVDHGPLMDLLRELNDFNIWREMYGSKSKRLKDEELILRFFALFYDADKYAAPMKTFLDRFSTANRDLNGPSADELRGLFHKMIDFTQRAIGRTAFRPLKAFNAAVFDAVAVGIARRLARGEVKDMEAIGQAYRELIKDPEFLDAYSKATAREEQVNSRLTRATKAFLEVV